MRVESLATKGLSNNDWAVLFFIKMNKMVNSDDIKIILSIPEWEVDESLEKLERMKIIFQEGHDFCSNVHK